MEWMRMWEGRRAAWSSSFRPLELWGKSCICPCIPSFSGFAFSRLFPASVCRDLFSEDIFLCSMQRNGSLLNYKGSSFPRPEGRPSFTADGRSAVTAFVRLRLTGLGAFGTVALLNESEETPRRLPPLLFKGIDITGLNLVKLWEIPALYFGTRWRFRGWDHRVLAPMVHTDVGVFWPTTWCPDPAKMNLQLPIRLQQLCLYNNLTLCNIFHN